MNNNIKKEACTEASPDINLNKKQLKIMDELTDYLRGSELTIREAQEMLSVCSENLLNINFNELQDRGGYYKDIPTMPVYIPMAWLKNKEGFNYDFIITQVDDYLNKYGIKEII